MCNQEKVTVEAIIEDNAADVKLVFNSVVFYSNKHAPEVRFADAFLVCIVHDQGAGVTQTHCSGIRPVFPVPIDDIGFRKRPAVVF